MKKYCYILMLSFLTSIVANAQNSTEKKHYPAGYTIGDAVLLEEWTESNGNQSTTLYLVEVRSSGNYFIKATTNMQKGGRQSITADADIIGPYLAAKVDGWQQSNAEVAGAIQPIVLTTGRHIIRFTVAGNMAPLIDGISLSRTNMHTKLDAEWQNFSRNLDILKAVQPVNTVTDKSNPVSTEKVLSNPQGNYEHAIDTAFAYSTFTMVYLNGGTNYTFTTSGSTVDPVLHLFDPNNIATRSWSNDDGGAGYESSLTVSIPASAYYYLLARPYYGGQSGLTNIQQDGSSLLTSTPIAGQRFYTTSRTGDLNYFTAKLSSGTNPDTRIFTLTMSSGVVTGYNDDYGNTINGTWSWGLCSRIRKNYSSGSTIVFVCAYNTSRTGVCDVYMGNVHGQLPNTEPGNFPLFKAEDAIQSAPSSGTYNCISWSGGITSSWSWPPNDLATWGVPGNPLASFDNFYANTPARYPGAWNYTRSGATSANAVVDLWKRPGGDYQHASVTKPGNAHPHGYDWESKPGGLDRQFHPRNALENNNWYGVVTNYYKPTGTYAKNSLGRSFETDADAVAAGIAVYENAKLSVKANDKLSDLLAQTSSDINNNFDRLYESWKQTWAANASLSDPDAYCKNKQFEALEVYCNKNMNTAILLVFKKFTDGDHLTTKLLLDLTRSRYIHLLDEAKKEYLENPYDERGRFLIHGDHDNGVRYIEKILQQLEIKPVETIVPAVFTVTTSPNPVKDVLTITVRVKEESRISVNAVSSQTGTNKMLQAEKTEAAGTHQYHINVREIAGTMGDMIIVQVKVNGVLQTMKVLVGN